MLVSAKPFSPTAVKNPLVNATRFRFVVVPLKRLFQLFPLPGLVAIKPFSPTVTNVLLPNATPRNHSVRVGEFCLFQLTPSLLVYTAPLSPTATTVCGEATTASSQSAVGPSSSVPGLNSVGESA